MLSYYGAFPNQVAPLEIVVFAYSHLASKKGQELWARCLGSICSVMFSVLEPAWRKNEKRNVSLILAGYLMKLIGSSVPSPEIFPESLGSVKDDLEESACKKLLLL